MWLVRGVEILEFSKYLLYAVCMFGCSQEMHENKIAGKASNDNNNGWEIMIIVLTEPVPRTLTLSHVHSP